MTVSHDFSYSFTLGADDRTPAEPDLYALDRLTECTLPGNSVLARNPRNGREMVLPLDVMNALSYCNDFATLNEHRETLLGNGPRDAQRANAVSSLLKSVRDNGLMLSAREVLNSIETAGSPQVSPGKPVVFVITWERPASLSRLLDSMIANCDLSAIDKCVVVDDSRQLDHCQQNRSIVSRADHNSDARFEYFGADEAHRFMTGLIGSLPDREEEIRFLLDRERWRNYWTVGISRNYCQLLSVGKPLIVCDDDAVCDVHESPFADQTVVFTDYSRDAIFYPDREAWPSHAAEGRRDPFERHMQLLGQGLPQALNVLNQKALKPDALKPAGIDLASRLGPDSWIMTTECASLGDPGTASNLWVATLPPQSAQQWAEHPERLPLALTQRNCWLGRVQPSFVSNSNISQITGFDNRRFLPPYFPIMRGQDQVFGRTCQFLYPRSLVLDMPWAAPHLPVEQRGWTPADNDFTRHAHFPGDLISPDFSLGDSSYSFALEHRLQALSEHYQGLSNGSDQYLMEQWANDWEHGWSVVLSLLDEQMRSAANAPESWRRYLATAYRQTGKSRFTAYRVEQMTSKDLDLSGRELVDFWRQNWGLFGRSLLAWQEIRDAAQQWIRHESA